MKTLNLLFFALLILFIHNIYGQYNTIFLQSFTFLFLFELIIVKIFNRILSKTTTDSTNNSKFEFNTLTNIDHSINNSINNSINHSINHSINNSINSANPYITNDKNTKHIVSAYDAMAKRNEYLFRIKYLDKYILKFLNDERDIVTAWTFINLIILTLPLISINLYFSSDLPRICAPLTFFFNTLTFTDRFILGLHYSSHRPIWKGRASFMNYIPSIFIAPFFGLPSGSYWTHHILMHHRHNNEVGGDLSSTEPYQRDNFWHFMHYWLRFLIGIWFELPLFALKHGQNFRKSWNGFFNCGIVLAIRVLFSSLIHLYLTYLSVVYIPWAGTW
jgi:hypothetical protein